MTNDLNSPEVAAALPQLTHADPAVRRIALIGIADYADEYPELFVEGSRDADPGVRLEATRALEGSAGAAAVNARERIGRGPWYNAKGVLIAKNVDELHQDNTLSKQTALTEKGAVINGRGDQPNRHDMLTGSDPSGNYSTAGGDTTCSNWTSSDAGSAILGHHDLIGLKDTRHMKSWNSSHGSAACSQDKLKATGGAGQFYCFAAN